MKTLEEAAEELAAKWQALMQIAVVEPLGRTIQWITDRIADSAAKED